MQAADDPVGTSLFRRFDPALAIEIAIVLLVFAAFAAVGTPDINETHYLTKAKHFWNPDWCAGDLFLESADAHYAFFIVCGWPSLFLSLDTFAWIGRFCCWIGLAIAWVRLNRVLGVGRWISPFSAALFVLLTNRFDMAGEWVIGGFEAKSVAYIFVLAAIELFVRRRTKWFWPILGIATALHAVVGVWALVCFTIAELVSRIFFLPGSQDRPPARLKIKTSIVPITIFIGLLLVGCLPPIIANSNTELDLVAKANEIQVHQRLTHHLLFGSFPTAHVARFAVLSVLWLIFIRVVRWNDYMQRFNWFCGASLLISLAGLILSGMAEQRGPQFDFANSLLRFYWFRFSDFAIPLGLSIICGRTIVVLIQSKTAAKRLSVFAAAGLIFAASCAAIYERTGDSRPPAIKASLPTYEDNSVRTIQTFENWTKVCRWVKGNTPVDALFITPVEQQTFKWYSHRAEVACWKDAPQDASDLVEWHRRISCLRTIEQRVPGGLLGLETKELEELAARFVADYLIVPQAMEDVVMKSRTSHHPTLTRVYPPNHEDRVTYVVYGINIDKDAND